MIRIQAIEEKLLSINGAAFQDLCDAYIFHTEPFCTNIHRIGRQRKKQKTISGTPDTVKSFRFSQHKSYLKEQILNAKKYAALERNGKFLQQDW